MGLDLGWRTNDVRETIWIEDDALVGVTAGAAEDWARDGDASHLLSFATAGQPLVFTFRSLTGDECEYVRGFLVDGAPGAQERAMLASFRLGVDFPTATEDFKMQDGTRRARTIRQHGLRMLSEEFVRHLRLRYRAIVTFYGSKIFIASFPSEPEKKASSPPSTPPPSSAAVTTSAGTVAQPAAPAPAA